MKCSINRKKIKGNIRFGHSRKPEFARILACHLPDYYSRYSFVHSFNKYFLSANYVPSAALVSEHAATKHILSPQGHYILVGEIANSLKIIS